MDPIAILSLLEFAANTTLAVLSTTGTVPAASTQLALGIENSINPLIASVKSGSATSDQVEAGYAAMLGVLGTIEETAGVDPVLLVKVNEYTAAGQDALAAFVNAGKGYNAGNYGEVDPLASGQQ